MINNVIFNKSSKTIKYVKLGDSGTFFGGLTGKSKNDFSNGNASYVTYKNIYSNLEVDLNQLEKVKVGNEKQNELKKGDILFTGSSENLEEVGLSSVITSDIEKVYLNSFCFAYRFNSDIKILPEFAKYLFRDVEIRKQIMKTANGVTRLNISKELMKKIKVPVPPIEIQKEIANKLDKFEAITKDITIGLPKEIELVQKMYEHYREKLLSFK